MLNSINLNDKTYEELLAEALSQIPLYSREWTNFNPSDPGITLLENFSAFSVLQQGYIDRVDDSIRRKLLKLLGMEPVRTHPARVLAGTGEALRLRRHRKYQVGELAFEPEEALELPACGIRAVLAGPEHSLRDITYLLGRRTAGAEPFGSSPAAGEGFLCLLTGQPDIGSPFRLWAEVDRRGRNPFDSACPISFARLRWEYYTAGGWRALEAEDGTNALLTSGEICLRFPAEEPAELETPAGRGCAIRCLVEEADYDIPPRLYSIQGNLFPLIQRETRCASFLFPGEGPILLDSRLAGYGNLLICCREAEGEPLRLYRLRGGRPGPGRFYEADEGPEGLVIRFCPEETGFGPMPGPDAVLAVCYDEEIVNRREVGVVRGYEGQELEIGVEGRLLAESFSLLLETADKTGEPSYERILPGEGDPDRLCYTLLPGENRIRIRWPGTGDGGRLFLCDCAVTAGGGGNIRSESALTPGGEEPGPVLFSAGPGRGGSAWESAEELRRRFAQEFRRPGVAVTGADYQSIVRETPGLCIDRVRAVYDEERNLVRVAVMPSAGGIHPQLTGRYVRQIRRWLEQSRMISTQVEVVSPGYVPIHVRGVIYVKNYYQNARTEIENYLAEALDTTRPGRSFGETIRYHEIFHGLELLPCVDSIYELLLLPGGAEAAASGSDLHLEEQCFSYLGSLNLELTVWPGGAALSR